MCVVSLSLSLSLYDKQNKTTQGKWPAEAGLKSQNCWCEPAYDYFRVRGINYLRDRKKIAAGQPFADLVATDWFVDYQRIDNVCARPTGTFQRKIMVRSPLPRASIDPKYFTLLKFVFRSDTCDG